MTGLVKPAEYHVCVITSSFPRGVPNEKSAGYFAQEFAEQLALQSTKTTVITQNSGPHNTLSSRFEVIRFNWTGADKTLSDLKIKSPAGIVHACSFFWSALYTSLRYINQSHPQHLFGLWAVPSGLVTTLCSKISGIPYSIWCLGSDIWNYGRSPIFKHLIRWILRGASHVYADGEELRREVEHISGRPCRFLSTSRTLPQPGDRPHDFSPAQKNYVFIGRLHSTKGPDILIRSAQALIRNKGPVIHFHIYGEGPMNNELRLLLTPEDEQWIHFHGIADGKVIATALHYADFCVIPSRADSIPVVFSESMQMNTPVIVSDIGDMPKLVNQFQVGYICESNNVSSLTQALLLSLNNSKESFKFNTQQLQKLFDPRESARRFIDEVFNS